MASEKLELAVEAVAAVTRQLVQDCGDDLENFAGMLAEKFHAGQRLVIIGSGPLAALAMLAANRFAYRLDIDRPPLPAVALAGDALLAGALGRDNNMPQYYARQLRAQAAEGDVVLVLAGGEQDRLAEEAISAAREVGCYTALLCSAKSVLLSEQVDAVFAFTTESSVRRDEAILFACQLLCELVEAELFGI